MKVKLVFIALLFKSLSFSQIIPIPDINFKNKLLQADINNNIAGFIKIDLNNNGEIEQSEALNVTYLFLFTSNISSLDGIEFFTNLQFLYCHYNSLSSLNITSLTQLKILRCDFNNLSNINLTGLTNLQGVNCTNNQINNLNFTGLNNLKSIICANNQITQLDFSLNPLFKELECKNNNLTSINLKNGINHDFSNVNFNDCWKTGNPNLATICVDASELASVQNHLNNCGTAQTISITSNCGLGGEEFAANKVVLYPNPTSSIININGSETIKSIELYDSLSRLLVSKIVGDNQSSLDLSNYSNGIYFVKISTENSDIIEKVVKQ
ncbi:T9SS type A sorting domain-containing protein [Flavobacterium koreense]